MLVGGDRLLQIHRDVVRVAFELAPGAIERGIPDEHDDCGDQLERQALP